MYGYILARNKIYLLNQAKKFVKMKGEFNESYKIKKGRHVTIVIRLRF